MSAKSSQRGASRWQQAENGFIAVAIILAMVAWSQSWWILLLAFLAFDLSALGYMVNQKVGTDAGFGDI